MVHHYPIPDAEGIAQTKTLYQERLGQDISDQQAHDILARVMHFLYAINQPDVNDLARPEQNRSA